LLQTLVVEDWSILLRLALWQVTYPFFNVYHVFEFRLATPEQSGQAPQLPAGMSVRLFRGEAEISRAAAQLMKAEMSASTLEERMRRGDLVAMLLTEAGEFVAHSWTMFTDAWIAEVGATLRLRSDEMVRYDTLVMPKWRGKDLYLRFNIACYRYLREEGYRRTLFWVYALNTRSLKTQFRQGKRKIATIVSSPLRGIVRLKDVAHEAGITLKKKKPSLAMESPWAKS
jgi:hypothetical protein